MYTTHKKTPPTSLPTPDEQIFLLDFTICLWKRVFYVYFSPQTKTPRLIIIASSNRDVISYHQVLSGYKRMDVTQLASQPDKLYVTCKIRIF